jgi:hypothetical protein
MSAYNINGEEIVSAFDILQNSLLGVYDISGNYIPFSEPIEPLPLDYSQYTTTDLFTYVANGFNGFDVYNGVIAQFMANNKLYLFDLTEHTSIATALSITSAHGDSASFSKVKQYQSDEFPLLYVTSDSNPANVYVNRITRTGTTLIKTLSFPLAQAGYYAAHAYDEDNQIIYMVGYSEQNFTSADGGNNKTVVSKWDISQLTDNGNGTFTPAFISRYERDFIYVMQGQQFFDGYIWISSGYNNGGNQYIYAMNPSTGVIDHTILLDDHIEIEGLAWVYDATQNKYWMLIGQQNGSAGINYSRIDFATAS